MKIYIHKRWVPFLKGLLIVKFIVILLITTLQANASIEAQKITLLERNSTLENVLKKISAQSNYDFVFSPKMLKESNLIDLELKDVSLQEALENASRINH